MALPHCTVAANFSTTRTTKRPRPHRPGQARLSSTSPGDEKQAGPEQEEMTGHKVSRFVEGEESTTPPPPLFVIHPTKTKRKQRPATTYSTSTFHGVCPSSPPPPPPLLGQAQPQMFVSLAASASSAPEEGSLRRCRADSSSSESDSLSSSSSSYAYSDPSQEEPPHRRQGKVSSAAAETSFIDHLEDTYVFDAAIYDKQDDEVYGYDENGHRIHHHHRPHAHSGPKEGPSPQVSKAEKLKALFHRGRDVVDAWKQPETMEERIRREARRQARAAKYENYGG